MGIYIKAMTRPSNCWNCGVGYEAQCPICIGVAGAAEYKTSRHPGCPLVEIKTPHGRLIDADKLYATVQSNESADAYVRFLLRHSSTVIEAEE